MEFSCAGKIGLREPGEHTSGPNLGSRDHIAHHQNPYRFWICFATGPTRSDPGKIAGYCRGPSLPPGFLTWARTVSAVGIETNAGVLERINETDQGSDRYGRVGA
jgi:hypothetical protein